MLDALSKLPELVINGFNTFVEGVGTGVASLFQSLFLVNVGTEASPVWQVSTMAAVGFVIMGITLAVGTVVFIVKNIKGRTKV